MAEGSVRHESLSLPGYWRITSFGKLTENPATARADLRIQTYLAPLSASTTSTPERAPTVREIRKMLLPVGELPRLHLNALLHDGKLVGDRVKHLHTEQYFRRNLDCSRKNIRIIKRFARDEFGDYIIPVREGWKDQLADTEMHGLFVAIGSQIDPYATIIPAIEVFRFFYATSDVLAKALLHDDFLDPETNLWNPDKTAIQPDGRALLWLRKKMLDADARFLARFAFDNYALQQAQEIFLHAASIGKSHGERMVLAFPPFQETVTTKFLGCPIIGLDGNRILVTRLLQCHWTPPFMELKWDRDNDGRVDPDKRPECPPADWRPNLYAPDQNAPEPSSLTTSAPSTPNIPSRLKLLEIIERFPELGKTPAEKLPQENAETRAEQRDWRLIIQEAYKGSVIEGQSSRDLIGRTIIESLQKKPDNQTVQTDEVDITIGQADYLVILELLKAIRNGAHAKVDFMAVLKSAKMAYGVQFNVYPKELDAKKKAWLYVDDNKQNSRMALVAKIDLDGRKRYVIELQQRKPGEASTLVVWRESEGFIQAGLVAQLLMDCAKAGAARLDSAHSFGLQWGRLHHIAQTTAEHFLIRIFEKVKAIPPHKK